MRGRRQVRDQKSGIRSTPLLAGIVGLAFQGLEGTTTSSKDTAATCCSHILHPRASSESLAILKQGPLLL